MAKAGTVVMLASVSPVAGFIADRIMEARDISLAKGRAKYKTYFVKTTIYLIFKADVDHILTVRGYADCIVTE